MCDAEVRYLGRGRTDKCTLPQGHPTTTPHSFPFPDAETSRVNCSACGHSVNHHMLRGRCAVCKYEYGYSRREFEMMCTATPEEVILR